MGVMHWTCLVILSYEPVLEHFQDIQPILHCPGGPRCEYLTKSLTSIYLTPLQRGSKIGAKSGVFSFGIWSGDKNWGQAPTWVQMVQPNNHSPYCWISNIYMPQQQSYQLSEIEKPSYSFQGIGGAFLGYLPEEGNRCRVRGYSCFKRLFDNAWNDLIHITETS